MRPTRVIVCWDGNPRYEGAWEVQLEEWPRFGIRPTLVCVSEHRRALPGDVVFLKPDLSLPHDKPPKRNWQAPMGVIYGPTMFPDEVVMTTGIDQVPLGTAFLDAISGVPDDKLTVGFAGVGGFYRECSARYGFPHYPSSHLCGKGARWAEALSGAPSDFGGLLKWAYAQNLPIMWGKWGHKWGLDETILSHGLHTSKVDLHLLGEDFWNAWEKARVSAYPQYAGQDPESPSELMLSHPPRAEDFELLEKYRKL